jgi:hypothetical protein
VLTIITLQSRNFGVLTRLPLSTTSDLCRVLDFPQVLQHFGEDPSKGLSDEQVLEQRAIYGPNELVPDKGTPFWKLVLKQFDDLLVKILIVAAVVDLIIAIINGETGASVFVEPGVIVLILIANGMLKQRAAVSPGCKGGYLIYFIIILRALFKVLHTCGTLHALLTVSLCMQLLWE